jgi:hypothetical protein
MDPGPASLTVLGAPRAHVSILICVVGAAVLKPNLLGSVMTASSVYYIKPTVHAAPMPINEAMETIG